MQHTCGIVRIGGEVIIVIGGIRPFYPDRHSLVVHNNSIIRAIGVGRRDHNGAVLIDKNPRGRIIQSFELCIGHPAVIVIEDPGNGSLVPTGQEKRIIIDRYPAGVGCMGSTFFTAKRTSQAKQQEKKRTDYTHKMVFARK